MQVLITRSVCCQFQACLVSTHKKKRKLTNHNVFIFQTNCTPHLPKADKGMYFHWFPWQNYLYFFCQIILYKSIKNLTISKHWKSNTCRRLLVASFCISFGVTFHFDCKFVNARIFVSNLYCSQTRLMCKLTWIY